MDITQQSERWNGENVLDIRMLISAVEIHQMRAHVGEVVADKLVREAVRALEPIIVTEVVAGINWSDIRKRVEDEVVRMLARRLTGTLDA